MKYKRLAKKLGVKDGKPGSLIAKMHSLKGMPKKHKFGTGKGLAQPFQKKHKEVPKALDKANFDGEKSFKKHKEVDFKKGNVMCKKGHEHTKFCR
jgi:hypothetical protein